MQENISRLSDLIARLIINIEDEFEQLNLSDQKNKIKLQKIITDSLAKLVELTLKLHKLSKEEGQDSINIGHDDMQIIENFLQAYNK